MSMFFELLDTSSGNLIKEFETEREAIDALRAVGHEYGVEHLRHLALLCFQNGHPTLVARDDELVALANGVTGRHRYESFDIFRAIRVTSAISPTYVTIEFLRSSETPLAEAFQKGQQTATGYLESTLVA
jgi:hypothetical protein